MFELTNLTRRYASGRAEVLALNNVSLKIEAGEFVAIMGPSGSGKSTLLHILGLLDRPDSGSFKLFGVETSSLSENRLAALRSESIGFVFQMFNLLPRTSAISNVSLPRLYASRDSVKRGKDPAALLEAVGLAKRANHKPNELSGGERQRVAVARALLNDPSIIVADEPTGNLDTKSTKEIMEILKDLHKQGKTIIMVTHEEDLGAMAERVIRLKDGEIFSDTKTKSEISSSSAPSFPDLSSPRAYLGVSRVKSYLSQAFKGLLANKTRSFLSILGVLIGVASVITMLALGEGARADVRSTISSMGSNVLSVRPNWRASRGRDTARTAFSRFTTQDAELIRRIPNVAAVSGVVTGNAQAIHLANSKRTRVLGAEPGYQDIFNLPPISGRFFTQEETISRRRVALIGKTVKEELYGDDDPLGTNLRLDRVNFTVIGVLPERGATGWRDMDDEVIIPLNTAMHRLLGKRYLDYIDVSAEEAYLNFVRTETHTMLTRVHGLTGQNSEMIEVRNTAEFQEAISETAKTFSWLLASIALVSLLVGGIGIMNIMLVSVAERTKEIGLRKALGAIERDILLQFVIEAVVICLGGGILGIVAGSLVSSLLSSMAGWSMKISPLVVFLAFSFSVGVGLIFGIWPASTASKLKPVDALRYE